MVIKELEKTKDHPADRRVRKTRTLLRQGLISLLMEKDIRNITINELVQKIDINRGTFYLHCKDLQDLLEQIEDETMDGLHSILEKYKETDIDDASPLFFIDLLAYVKANADLCRLLLDEKSRVSFFYKIKKLVEENCFDTVKRTYQLENPIHYGMFSAFAVSGSIGVIQLWLKNGCHESLEEVADALLRLIQTGLGYLKDSK